MKEISENLLKLFWIFSSTKKIITQNWIFPIKKLSKNVGINKREISANYIQILGIRHNFWMSLKTVQFDLNQLQTFGTPSS